MAYTVLARKYRSQRFDEVIGQDAIVRTLQNAIKAERIAHAYLFAGTRGVGKTTMARILAKSLNCLSADKPTPKPCCKCDSCLAVHTGQDIDVIEIDGASNNSVEEVRRLRENAVYRPARARFKIYIIDEVHMLSVSAFNALLKILEEPPEHVKFIFATTEPNKVIATIQSRCQRFDFANISPKVIAEQLRAILKKEKLEYEDQIVIRLARMANGSMRDGLSLLDRLLSTGESKLTVGLMEEFLGITDADKVYELLAKTGDGDSTATLLQINTLIAGGCSELQIADAVIDCMRDLIVLKSAGPNSELLVLTDNGREKLNRLAEKFDVAGLIYAITVLGRLRWTLKNSETARALLDAVMLRFCMSEHFMNVEELLGKSPQPAGVKKKLAPDNTASQPVGAPNDKTGLDTSTLHSLQEIRKNWDDIVALISHQAGGASAGLLASAEPVSFDDGLMKIKFNQAGEVSKKLFESNGRSKKAEEVLTEQFGRKISIRITTDTGGQQQDSEGEQPRKTTSQKRDEIANEPAVKMMLMELGATITNIQVDEEND